MKINFKHKWDITYNDAVKLQKSLREKLILKNHLPKNIKTIAGIDVSFSKLSQTLFASIVVLDFSGFDILEISNFKAKAEFPYVPGLLSFREAPTVLEALKRLKTSPDILMFDGQGIAHPREFGIASHVGVIVGKPSIGCAKKKLVGSYSEPGIKKGSFSKLSIDKKTVGSVLRSRDNVKPIFVSPGYMMTVEKARGIVIKCLDKYRLPLPTRLAHIESNIFRKNENEKVL